MGETNTNLDRAKVGMRAQELSNRQSGDVRYHYSQREKPRIAHRNERLQQAANEMKRKNPKLKKSEIADTLAALGEVEVVLM